MNKYIAFDLDGTLIDIKARDYAIYCDILYSLNCKPLDLNEYWEKRRNQTNIFEILNQSNVPLGFHNKFLLNRQILMEKLQYLKLDTLFDDTISQITRFKANYKLAIVTRRENEQNTFKQLAWLGLDKLVDVIIVTGDDKTIGYKKLGAIRGIVGDTENDFFASKSLNSEFIGITTGIRNRERLDSYGIENIIDSLSQLDDYIK